VPLYKRGGKSLGEWEVHGSLENLTSFKKKSFGKKGGGFVENLSRISQETGGRGERKGKA